MRSDPRTGRAGRLAVAALVLSLAYGPPAGAAARVALVRSSGIGPFAEAASAIAEALRRDPLQPEILTFDLEGDRERAAAVVEALRAQPPALIVSVGSLATAAVLEAEAATPVVFSMVLYPRESGFVSRPGRGVTGASLDVPYAVQFGYLKRLVPSARRVGVLYHPAETGRVVEEARRAATALGLELVAREVPTSARAVPALESMLGEIDVLWSVADGHVFTPQTASGLLLTTMGAGVPTMGLSAAHVRSGALAALACDYGDVGRQSAEVALRVLRGEPAESVPVAAPRRVLLFLNLRTASHLGVEIADDLRTEAAEVVP